MPLLPISAQCWQDDFEGSKVRACGKPRPRRPAVFLDRDGVINDDLGYVGHPSRFLWKTGVFEAIRLLNRTHSVFIATNQSGVARGFFTNDDVTDLHRWMLDELERRDACVDDIRWCPYHPDGTVAEYARPSRWRKPQAGMLLDLMKHWDVAEQGSFVIGDKPSDLEAARAVSLPGFQFHGTDLNMFVRDCLRTMASEYG